MSLFLQSVLTREETTRLHSRHLSAGSEMAGETGTARPAHPVSPKMAKYTTKFQYGSHGQPYFTPDTLADLSVQLFPNIFRSRY